MSSVHAAGSRRRGTCDVLIRRQFKTTAETFKKRKKEQKESNRSWIKDGYVVPPKLQERWQIFQRAHRLSGLRSNLFIERLIPKHGGKQ